MPTGTPTCDPPNDYYSWLESEVSSGAAYIELDVGGAYTRGRISVTADTSNLPTAFYFWSRTSTTSSWSSIANFNGAFTLPTRESNLPRRAMTAARARGLTHTSHTLHTLQHGPAGRVTYAAVCNMLCNGRARGPCHAPIQLARASPHANRWTCETRIQWPRSRAASQLHSRCIRYTRYRRAASQLRSRSTRLWRL